jgi:hypothetical protein
LFHLYTETESFDVSIEPKKTEDQTKQFDGERIVVFFKQLWVVSKQFCLFQLFRYKFETPKQTELFVFGFTKQTETQMKQILLRFVSVRTYIFLLFVSRTPYLEQYQTRKLKLGKRHRQDTNHESVRMLSRVAFW